MVEGAGFMPAMGMMITEDGQVVGTGAPAPASIPH